MANPITNRSKRLTGINPLAYLGVDPETPPQMVVYQRAPLVTDWQNYSLGTFWLNQATQILYILVDLTQNIATWIPLASGSSDLVTLTGNSGGPVNALANNINVVGAGDLTIVGNPGTHTLTATLAGDIAHSFVTNAGTATPSAGILNVVGSGNITTTGAGNTVTASFTGVLPIANGGTNAASFATTDGTVIFDGTRLVTTTTGTSGQVLVSNGPGVAPTFQTISAGVGSGGILGTGSPDSTLANTATTSYYAPFGFAPSATQASAQFIMPVAGTLSRLYVNVTANGSTTPVTVTLNVNSANSALTTSITALTTGKFFDLTHSVAVLAGDFVQFQMPTSTTANVFGIISVDFMTAGAAGTGSSVLASGSQATDTIATLAMNWIRPGGIITSNQSAAELVSPVSGVLSKMYVRATSNASTTNTTFTLNINGANTAVVVTVTALTTGSFSDLTHSVAVSQGDLIQWESQATTTGSIVGTISMKLVA